MKKTALITGGTKGIGAAIASVLSNEYNVVTVGRSENANVRGDLFDPVFRQQLIKEFRPYIFVNNAANLYLDPFKMLEISGTIPVELLMKFYTKMTEGMIINIGSLSSEIHVRPKDPMSSTAYALGKKHLKDMSLGLNYSKNKPVKVMCVSPALTHTEMVEKMTEFRPAEDDYKNFNFHNSIAWYKPEEVANIVKFLIDLPPHIIIPEIVLDNHYAKAVYM